MASCERALGVRSTKPAEYEHFSEVDEGEPRRAAHDVVHEKRYALRVIDHPTHAEPGRTAHTRPGPRPCRFTQGSLLKQERGDYKGYVGLVSR